MPKTWEDIEHEVEAEMLDRFASVPLDQRTKLGLEGNSTKSYDNRQWVQIYVQMLSWKNKCRELHEQASPADDNNPAGDNKIKLKRIK